LSKKNSSLDKSDNIEKRSDRQVIRQIQPDEVDSAAALMARLKKLNGEFDPLLKTSDRVEDYTLKAIKTAMNSKDSVVLVALNDGKVVGVVKADLKDRVFYEPRKEGAIVEFYILPEFRRTNLGKHILDSVMAELKKKGAVLITAEFPSQNDIAKKFYTKLGFRSLTNVYAK
jgi:ribosomal protein S18 acetylase RimI-like enzyme